MASLGLVLAPGVAEAQENPTDCLNNCFSLDILKDKSAVHNGEYITYTVCAANNNGTCPDPCNMEDVTISLTLPDENGLANGAVVTVEPGRDFPANGSADWCYNASQPLLGALYFHVLVNAGVTSITARADYAGSLMDGPPGGDPSASFKTLSVTVLNPCVNVTKTADTPFSKVGDNITYTIKVCNCGDADLTKVSIIDDKLGNLTGSFAATLLAGNCESHTFTHTVTASDPNPLVNEVEVIYEDYTAYAVSDTATASVPLVHPSLTIDKTGPATAIVGATITYTFVIKNTSPDTALDRQSVTDTKLGDITASFPAALAIGESKTVTKTYTVKVSDPNPLVNVVTATYVVPTLGNEVKATDSHSVGLLTPKLCIDKTVDCNDDLVYSKTETTYGASDDADWKVVVTNCGDAPVYNITVTDTNLHAFGAKFDLAVGASKTFNYTTTITTTTTNTATAVGKDEIGGTVGPVSSSATNQILNPILCIDKTVDCNDDGVYSKTETTYGASDDADWKVVVTNCGTDPVYNITVTDTNLHAFGAKFDLAVGASKTFNYTTTITTTTTNTATAVGKNAIGGTVGPVSSSATNQILNPKLCIDKTVDCNDDGVYSKEETTTGPSDDADWKVVVTNCGTDPVYNITVTDTNGHDFSPKFDLAVGASKTFNYTTTITTTTTNTATAVGKNAIGGTVGPVSSSATNRIVGLGCLQICKFQDTNVNAMWDPGEPWLPDWRFHVTGPSGYDKWVSTGPEGCVLISGLDSGTYTVTEELEAGWYNTRPGGNSPYEQEVIVETGLDCARVEFGNREEIKDVPPMIPAMNQWGIIAMIAVFAGLLVWMVRRKRLAS
jgi:hypothetical protein